MFKISKQYCLIALMALTLLGIQAVQESPLHDHSQHEVDCAVCHFSMSDDSVVSSSKHFVFTATRSVYHATVKQFNASHTYSLYESRAPPHLFL